MLDPRINHLDKTNFQLFDPFRNINNDHVDKSRKQPEEDEEEAEIELKLLVLESSDDSGIHSPPLWKNNNNSIPLSPMSRREAIITGQKELMDMVKNIPESSYELSLKDLVRNQEQYLLHQDQDQEDEEEEEVVVQVQVQESNCSKKREIKRAYSVDNNKGLFLKMVFPVGNNNTKSRKKNILVLKTGTGTEEGNIGKTGKSSVEKYWWKKKFSSISISSESDGGSSRRSTSRSNTSSSSSSRGSTNTRERRSMLNSCMTCFHSSKNQSAE